MADWLPKLFWSPSEIEAYLQELDSAFSGFYSDIQNQSGTFNPDELDQLEILDADYHKWKTGLHFWDYGAAYTVDTGKRYALRLKFWIDQFNLRTGNKLTGPGVSLIAPTNVHEPLISASFGTGGLMDKEQTDKLQTMVVAICVAVGLSAIARTLRG